MGEQGQEESLGFEGKGERARCGGGEGERRAIEAGVVTRVAVRRRKQEPAEEGQVGEDERRPAVVVGAARAGKGQSACGAPKLAE